MRIAQVPPLYEATPPKLYGGTERVVAHLSDALVDLGHDVTLYSSAESCTRAKLVVVRDQAIRLDPAPLKSDLAAHLTMLNRVAEDLDKFDMVHFHVDMVHFPMFEAVAARTVTTLHGRLDLKDLAEVYRRWNRYPLVSISNAQRTPLPVRQLGGHGLSWLSRKPLPFRGQAARLLGVPWADVAGEGSRSRHCDRQAAGHATADGGKGGSR